MDSFNCNIQCEEFYNEEVFLAREEIVREYFEKDTILSNSGSASNPVKNLLRGLFEWQDGLKELTLAQIADIYNESAEEPDVQIALKCLGLKTKEDFCFFAYGFIFGSKFNA